MHVGLRASGLLAAALLSADCGYLFVELGELDGGGKDRHDAGGPARDASGMDASFDTGADGTTPRAPDAFVDSGRDGSSDASSDGSAPDAFVDSGPQPCNFAGTWVSKVTAAMSWPSGLAITAGSGTSYIWAKFQMTKEGTLVPGSMVPCGVTLPDFTAGALLGGEHYGVDFNIPLFDDVPPQAVATDGTLQVNGAGLPGDIMTLSDTATVLGTTLTNPLTDTWPSASALVNNDMDGDGKPGITVPHLNDATHIYLPVNALRTARSDRGYYAARMVLSASGTVMSCSEITGQAAVSRYDTHIVGCSKVGGGQCSTTERDTLDTYRPIHQVDSATYHAVKVASDATCAVARSTLP